MALAANLAQTKCILVLTQDIADQYLRDRSLTPVLQAVIGGKFAQQIICKGLPYRSEKEEEFYQVLQPPDTQDVILVYCALLKIHCELQTHLSVSLCTNGHIATLLHCFGTAEFGRQGKADTRGVLGSICARRIDGRGQSVLLRRSQSKGDACSSSSLLFLLFRICFYTVGMTVPLWQNQVVCARTYH